jgi:hypothetical protein
LKKINLIWIPLGLLALFLGACRSTQQPSPTATLDAQAVYTAAAQTADAKLTEIAAVTPTAPPATNTPVPETPTPEAVTPSATAVLTPTATLPAAAADKAQFVTDVTIPDGTEVEPNDTFLKTWQLKNVGNTTWTTNYSLVFVSGAQMGGPATTKLPYDVAPNQSIDLSVNLTAPADPGTHLGYWILQNANGQSFGIGDDFKQAFWVEIEVPGESGDSSGTAQPTSDSDSSGDVISDVTISVDNASFSGECPHTFTINAQITMSQAASITYQLEADSQSGGANLDLPDPVNNAFGAGTHSLQYELEITASMNGWARLHITSPEDVSSDAVNFTLQCQ